MPASDDTEIQKLDTSAVGPNLSVIDLTGTPSQLHGNERRVVEDFANTGEIKGNSYTTYKDSVRRDAANQHMDKGLMQPTDGFVLIKKGIRVDPNTNDNKSAGSKKSENTNSFALLDFDDVDDNITQKAKDNHDTSTDDNEKLLDLLFPPIEKSARGSKQKFLQKLHDNIARSPTPNKNTETTHNLDTKKKKKKQKPIPEILKILLHKHAYAMEAIEHKILRKRQNDVSVQDLAWYIANTKPRFGHMKAQLTQECGVIQRDAAKDFQYGPRNSSQKQSQIIKLKR